MRANIADVFVRLSVMGGMALEVFIMLLMLGGLVAVAKVFGWQRLFKHPRPLDFHNVKSGLLGVCQ